MKLPRRLSVIVLGLAQVPGGVDAAQAKSNPIDKTIELMSDLQASIIKDGEDEEKAFREYYNWCDDAEAETRHEIKTQKASKEKLTATIERASSDAENANTKVEELTEAISSDERKLKEASQVRHTAKADFDAAEQELVEAVDMLRRAAGILEKEMQGGAAFAQGAESENLQDVLLGLASVVDAAGFLGEEDKQKLAALVQRSMDEDSDEAGAPAAAAYEGHSGGIVQAMEDMKDKAETQLNKERQEETKDKHNFELLEQSLKDSIADNQKNLANQKSGLAESNEVKATAEGKLAEVVKDLAASMERRSDLQHDCMEKASNHETTVTNRKEELAVIAKAKKIIQATTGGATDQMYGESASFLQMSSKVSLRLRAGSRVQAAGIKVVQMIQRLAKQQHSAKLGQLASRVSVLMQYSSADSSDPFSKVKGLISDMIAKLEGEASEEAQEKAYCDEEMHKTGEKKGELESETDGLKARIDEDETASTQLKEQVKDTQADLAALAELQAGMDKARQDANAAYTKAKTDLEQGLGGVRKAIQVLREYYVQEEEPAEAPALLQDGQPAAPESHRKVEGAGVGIISLLEVIESDMAKTLTAEESEESAAADEYETLTQENKVTKASKEQAVKMQTQEFKALDKTVSEHSGDLDTASTELSAVNEYHGKLKERCIAKPDSYEERKKRRDAEVTGLQEALSILEGETALIQRRR